MRTNYFLKTVLTGIVALLFVPFLKGINTGTVTTITYYSTTQKVDCKMNVYVPYGYDQEADTVNSYPVFYLIHGGGENYTHWVNSGNAKGTLDEFIAAGKAVPMILVMPDAKNLAADVFAKELINDIIPYIEKNYRVKADKDHRGVGGLSWGGLQAMEAGIYHYEMFGYLSVLSSGWFTNETATYNRAKAFLSAHGKDMEKSIRYLYFSEGTSTDIAYNNGMATLKVLRDSGLTVHYWEHPGGHQWSAWREDFRSFAPFLFRDTATKYVSLAFQGGIITNSTIMTHLDSVIAEPVKPVRYGYTFAGWYKDAACLDSFDFAHDTIKKNITLYAKWSINSYKISFNSNGGSAINDTIVANYNTLITAPIAPVKSGYVFDGWYTNGAFTKKWDFSKDRVPNTDITLVAKWVDIASVSVDKVNMMKIAVFPNPVKSVLQINNLHSDASVAIFGIDGKLMVTEKLKAPNGTINVEALPEGFYKVKISNASFEMNQNIVVKR
ncbi:MAG TPA: InlB B-repeat-containing protein [Bacteroidales bacterium]|nr:InlB B-repeat-containing protein [Bacteroidales bacterium]